jgi:hypothetical protein
MKMDKTDTVHVQTESTEDEYEMFRKIIDECGMTIKETGHEAIVRWVENQQSVDPTDRAFTVLDELDETSLPPTAVTDTRHVSDIVEEWSGSDVSFTLADNPSEHRE